jgi:hypothetical protein
MVYDGNVKGIQLIREGILYPGLAKSDNSQSMVNTMEKITVKETSREQEKEEIRTLFRNNGTLYYSDIVKRLGINLRTVVEICDELAAAGEIAIDKSI